MIIKKTWNGKFNGYIYRYKYTGWFLLGFIPLYICREER